MKGDVIYISGGKMFRFDGKDTSEIRSGMLDRYMTLLRDTCERNEWKSTGSGAQFTGISLNLDTEAKLRNTNARVTCVVPFSGRLVYALSIDSTSGIYVKDPGSDDDSEGIAVSSKNCLYKYFDIYNNRIVASAASLGESHIGIAELSTCDFRTVTEGSSYESSTCFSRSEPDCIYYESAGLLVEDKEENETREKTNEAPMMTIFRSMAEQTVRENTIKGPSGIYRMNLSSGEIDDILVSSSICYTKPQSCENGDLYFVRRPYKQESGVKNSLGCLLDLLLLPVRLIWAIFGFFNVFSMKYSGKTLNSGAMKSKNKSAKDRFIDGNLVNAARSLKENTDKGEKYPGIIPRSYELCKLDKNGKLTLVRKGVLDYRLTPDGIYFSNGSYIIRINNDGTEEKICKADAATSIAIE